MQRNVFLLDCTLRDGGYVNDWVFGESSTKAIIKGLADSRLDIIEIGFLRDEIYQRDRTVFSEADDIKRIIEVLQRKDVLFTAMIEAKEDVTKQFPLEKIESLKESGLNFIRIMSWEWLMETHMDYIKRVSESGVLVSVQPTAVVDYDDTRFMELIELTNEIHPYAFYLVDTWGTESPHKICRLAQIADENLERGIKLGYHGHNNKMQGLACLEGLLQLELNRDILCDVSLGGMGKGPGNLQTEVVCDYLNECYEKAYDVDAIYGLYTDNIREFYEDDPWGYSLYHFMGSRKQVTQNYATYFKKKKYDENMFLSFVESLKGREKVLFSVEFTERRLKELGVK